MGNIVKFFGIFPILNTYNRTKTHEVCISFPPFFNNFIYYYLNLTYFGGENSL